MPDAKARPRQRRREANEQRILDAAMEAIAAGGYANLSMNKLAEAVDYTPGALYRYFASKDVLLAAVMERVLDGLEARIAAALATVPADRPLARVVAITRAYRAFAAEERHEFGLIAMSLAEPEVLLNAPEALEPVVQSMISTMTPAAEALEAAAAAGQLSEGPAMERTLLLFAAVQGVLLLRKQARVAPGIIDLDRLGRSVLQTLLTGWGADPAAIDAAHEAQPGGPT